MVDQDQQVERDAAVALVFAEVARRLQGLASRQETWQRLVDIAADLLPEFEHAAISLVHPSGRINTVAASDDVARTMGKIQYECGEGPGLSAIREHDTFLTADLAGEDRWPTFTRRAVAAETGVRSMLSAKLFVQEETLGALNLYNKRLNAFDGRARSYGQLLAAHGAIAMSAADEHEHVIQLEAALGTNRQIGVALGILMTQSATTSAAGFAMLKSVSSRTNVKLAVIADRIVAAADERAGRGWTDGLRANACSDSRPSAQSSLAG